MGIAFEMALGSFGATPGSDDPIRAALAHKIIAQAHAGERDPEQTSYGWQTGANRVMLLSDD
jgi:hypothetical protein